jgi:hypothetical protein
MAADERIRIDVVGDADRYAKELARTASSLLTLERVQLAANIAMEAGNRLFSVTVGLTQDIVKSLVGMAQASADLVDQLNTQAEATDRLPLINIIQPDARRERQTQLTEFRGTTTLRFEVLATGSDGETAGALRDSIADAIETALVASDVRVPDSDGARWIASGWELLGIVDQIGMRDGALLISSVSLECELQIQDAKSLPDEDHFGALDIEVATSEPDDSSVEMEVEVNLGEES